MPARLTIHHSELPAQRLALEEGGDYLVGRDPACDLRLEDARVSRRHARILQEADGTWKIEHLGSKNGLSVDAVPCFESAALADDAWIDFGGLLGRFQLLSEDRYRDESREELSRWQTTLHFQRQLDPSQGLDALLKRVLSSILELADFERGFVMLAREDGELELAATVQLEETELLSPGFSGSVGAVQRALDLEEPVLLADARLDLEMRERHSILAGKIRALICLPLSAMGRTLGVAYADSRLPGSELTELDASILTSLASHASLAIAVARIQQEVQGMEQALPTTIGAPAPRAKLPRAWEHSLVSQSPRTRDSSSAELTWSQVLSIDPGDRRGRS